MTLADLIDLEVQLARDRDGEPSAVEERDRALLPDRGAAQPRRALIGRWLEALRERDRAEPHPGRAIEGALRALRAILVAIGAVLGWGAATAVLRYAGAEPVNVWDFLLLFVGVQILLLALLLGSFFLPLAAAGAPLAGLFRSAVAALYPRLAAPAIGGKLADWRVLWHRLRSRRSLYRQVEPWVLLGLTQSFGVAFNIGALLGCLRLIVFSDIAFSWSTTLVQLDAARFHAIVHSLAAPFAWLWPDADPSPALVAATRYSRLDSAYVLSGARRAAHPEMVGGWWPFLIASLAFYGLLPRCLTLAIARIRTARLLAQLPLDDVEVTRVVHRLSAPLVQTGGAAPPAQPEQAMLHLPPPAAFPAGTACSLLLWRDVPGGPALEQAVARQTGCTIKEVHAAGGRDSGDDDLGWAGADPVAVVAEGWEAPDKGVLRLLSRLRRALGPRRHVVVLLANVRDGTVAPSPGPEVRIWREGLAALEDPWLSIDPLRGGS